MTRGEIEKKWLDESCFRSGTPLCRFTERLKLDSWKDIWESQDEITINDHFEKGYDEPELSYLTRALSLHMLLDDMGLD